MNPQRARDMEARAHDPKPEPMEVESGKEAEVALHAVPRNGRYGTLGTPVDLGINCFRAEMLSTPDKITQYNLDFYSERKPDPNSFGGRGGRGGRGRGRGGRGGGRGAKRTPDEKAPPLRIATELVERIMNASKNGDKVIEKSGQRFPEGCRLAYDGKKNVYTSMKPDWREAVFELEDHEKKYEIQFRACAVVDIDHLKAFISKEKKEVPDAALNCLDIAMRTRPLRQYVLTGRSFSINNGATSSVDRLLGSGCEAWRGYYQALKPVSSGLGLFFDVSYSAFYKEQSLIDFVVDVLQPRGSGLAGVVGVENLPDLLSPYEHKVVRNELRGLRCVNMKAPPHIRSDAIIDDVTTMAANQIFFEEEFGRGGGRRVTVQEYWEETFHTPLKYPRYPCVEVEGKGRKKFHIPLEFARLSAGQRRTKRMPAQMTSKMIEVASRKPDIRRKDILDMLDVAGHNEDEYVDSFGIKIDKSPMKVKARLLDPPRIAFKDLQVEMPATSKELTWSIAPVDAAGCVISHRQLFKAKNALKHWGVLVLARKIKDTTVVNFVKCLQETCEKAGLEVAKPRYCYSSPKNMLSDMQSLNSNVSSDSGQCQLLLIIKEDDESADYNRVKLIGDTVIGVPTQCCRQEHVENPRQNYCQNVMLKINAKLGGINVRVVPESFSKYIGEESWMVIGADLSHAPAADAKDNASVTACVATTDRSCSAYDHQFRLQAAKTETIAELGDMVGALLTSFNNKNGFFPEKLLVYRDGVSDGQYQTVLTEEVNVIKEECHKIGKANNIPGGYDPKLTFIILQKRHHTRFFPLNEDDGDISGNVRAGTVIDSDVTHARNYDFYLYSHNGIKGTSRPVRYTVLYDDNEMGPDELQSLTYNMCFTYARCTRSVSIPPVAYYSDLLACRVRAYLSSKRSAEIAKDSAGNQPGYELLIGPGEPTVRKELANRLFYV